MNNTNKYTIILLFVVMGLNAQTDNYWSGYVPLFTQHFQLTDDGYEIPYHDSRFGSQGGQGGLLVSYNIPKHNYISTHTAGVSQNSFGDLIGIVTKGYAFGNRFRVGIESGFTVGYKRSYLRQPDRSSTLVDFTIKYGFTPIATSTIAYDITKKIGIKAILNPIYINFGINFKFNNGKK